MRFGILTIILATLFIIGCSPKQSDYIIARFDNQEITLDEFNKEYDRNFSNHEVSKTDSIDNAREFLDLYTLYKLKLAKAFEKGYQNDADLLKEYDDYKFNTGKNYLISKFVEEKGIKQLYENQKFEYRIAHILISIDSTRTEKEAATRFNDAMDELKQGKTWEELVSNYSDDPRGKTNGGDLYYVTPGALLESFETAILNTPAGFIYSKPIRSRAGFHLLKVTEKIERIPSVRVKHILINEMDENQIPDFEKAEEIANEVLLKLKNGAVFDSLAVQYSDDKNSAKRGGDIGFVRRNSAARDFEEAAFKTPIGNISEIIKTKFGYHILIVTEHEKRPSLEEEALKIKALYEKTKFKNDFKKYVDSLKTEFTFKINNTSIKEILNKTAGFSLQQIADSTELLNGIENVILFEAETVKYSFNDLLNYEKDKGNLSIRLTETTLTNELEQYSNEKLLELKVNKFVSENEEFKQVLNEYRNGLYIFKLQEDEVWSKVEISEEDLKNYYNSNKDEFKWRERLSYTEIYSFSKKMMDSCYTLLNQGISTTSIDSIFGKDTRVTVTFKNHIAEEVSEKEEHQKILNLEPGKFIEPYKSDRKFTILFLNEKIPAGPKTFEEAEDEVGSKLREIRTSEMEDKFIKQLEAQYNPEKYYEKLENLFD